MMPSFLNQLDIHRLNALTFKMKEKKPVNTTSKSLLCICVSMGLLILMIIVSLNTGYAQIPFSKILQIVMKNVPILGDLVQLAPGISEAEIGIVMQIRLPRTLSAAVAGAALAVAGLVYQGIFRNQMVGPYVIGASSGAALGGVLAITLGLTLKEFGFSLVPLFAFLGCLFSLLLVYWVSRYGYKVPKATLLLTGFSLNILFSVVFSYIQIGSGFNVPVNTWLMGSFSNVMWIDLISALPLFFVGIIIIYVYAGALNTLILSENVSGKSGVHFERTHLILLFFSALITAAAVSIGGIIGFAGLLIPHLVKRMMGSDHRFLIPCSAILGAVFLISFDCLSRAILMPSSLETAVGLFTATLGVPFFIYLLLREKDWLPQRQKELGK